MAKKKWMKGAVKRPGALTKKAEAAGESPMEFAREHAHAPGLTGKQARFAMIAQHEPIPAKKEEKPASRAERLYSKKSVRRAA